MGHLGEVHHHGFPRDVLTQPHGERIAAGRERLAVQGLPQVDGLAYPVGQLDPDERLARDHFHHPHAAGRERTGEIPGKIGDLARLHARRQVQFEAGNDGTGIDAHHLGLHVVIGELRLHQPAHALQLVLAHHLGLGGRPVQQIDARQRGQTGLGTALGFHRRSGNGSIGFVIPLRPGQVEVIFFLAHGGTRTAIGHALALGGRRRSLVLFVVKLRIELEGVFVKLRQPFVSFCLLSAILRLGVACPAAVGVFVILFLIEAAHAPFQQGIRPLIAGLTPATGEPAAKSGGEMVDGAD